MQGGVQTEEYLEYEDMETGNKAGWKEKLEGILDVKYFVPAVVVLVSVISFCLGRISGLQEKREPVRVVQEEGGEVKGISAEAPNGSSKVFAPAGEGVHDKGPQTSGNGSVVASKNGTKYHYPWCSGADRISAKNLITFDSIESARAAGYTPASNCKGLK